MDNTVNQDSKSTSSFKESLMGTTNKNANKVQTETSSGRYTDEPPTGGSDENDSLNVTKTINTNSLLLSGLEKQSFAGTKPITRISNHMDSPMLKSCVCDSVFANFDASGDTRALTLTCSICEKPIAPFKQLYQKYEAVVHDRSNLENELHQAKAALEHEKLHVKTLRARLDKLEDELIMKSSDLDAAKDDMTHLSNRLVQEATRRIDFEHQAHDVQNEIESLTQSLFEKANEMVASEARKRQYAEDEKAAISIKLDQNAEELGVAQSQLKELKTSLSKTVLERDEFATKLEFLSKKSSKASFTEIPANSDAITSFPLVAQSEEPADLPVFEQFQVAAFADFCVACQALPCILWHHLPFFSLLIDRDLLPGLHFAQLSDIIPWRNDCFPGIVDARSPHPQSAPALLSSPTGSSIPQIRKETLLSPDFRQRVSSSKISPNHLLKALLIGKCQIEEIALKPESKEAKTSCVACLRVYESWFPSYRLSFVSSEPSRRTSGTLLLTKSPTSELSLDSRSGGSTLETDVEYEHIYIVCKCCRNQIVAVAEFVAFIRQISLSLHQTKTVSELYLEHCLHQHQIFMARYGVNHTLLDDFEASLKALKSKFIGGSNITLHQYGNSLDFGDVLHSQTLRNIYNNNATLTEFKHAIMVQLDSQERSSNIMTSTGWGFPWRGRG